jgi:hypothetical protein
MERAGLVLRLPIRPGLAVLPLARVRRLAASVVPLR